MASVGNPDYQAYLRWIAGGGVPDPAPRPVVSTVIAAFDYLNRFTNAEIDGLNAAALASPPTAASLALFKFLTQTAAQGSVDLAGPRLATAHALLVARGLITAARSVAILAP